jgi:hypothetical protein
MDSEQRLHHVKNLFETSVRLAEEKREKRALEKKQNKRKIDLKVESKVGSLDNVKHRPGGGDKKVFNDIEYLKQMNDTTGAQLMAKSSGQNSECSSRRESAVQVKFRKSGNPAAQNNGPVSLDFLRSIPKSKPTNEVSSGTYKYQMRRRLSPMSSGF